MKCVVGHRRALLPLLLLSLVAAEIVEIIEEGSGEEEIRTNEADLESDQMLPAWTPETHVERTPAAPSVKVLPASASDRGECLPKLDLIFLLDTSGSIEQIYQEHVRWAISLVDSLQIEKDAVHVAAVQYAGFPLTEFALGTYPSVEDIRQHLQQISFQSGVTRTGYALRKAESELFREDRGARKDALKVLILFTDGLSVDDPLKPATQLRDLKGVKIYVVSVGMDGFETEMSRIAGNRENVFGPSELPRLRNALLNDAERARACSQIGPRFVDMQRTSPAPPSDSLNQGILPPLDFLNLNDDDGLDDDDLQNDAKLAEVLPQEDMDMLMTETAKETTANWTETVWMTEATTFKPEGGTDNTDVTVAKTEVTTESPIASTVETTEATTGGSMNSSLPTTQDEPSSPSTASQSSGETFSPSVAPSTSSSLNSTVAPEIVRKEIVSSQSAPKPPRKPDTPKAAGVRTATDLIEQESEDVFDLTDDERINLRTSSSSGTTSVASTKATASNTPTTSTTRSTTTRRPTTRRTTTTTEAPTETTTRRKRIRTTPSRQRLATAATEASTAAATPSTRRRFTPRRTTVAASTTPGSTTGFTTTTTRRPSTSRFRTSRRPGAVCPMDLLFILDSSGSVQRIYDDQKEYLREILMETELADNMHRVSLLQFAGSNIQKTEWSFDAYEDHSNLMRALNHVRLITGTTYIGAALDNALQLLEERRKNTPTLVVLISDGFSQDDATGAAEKIRHLTNVEFFALSMADLTNRDYLEQLSGSPDNVFVGARVDELRDVLIKKLHCR